MHSFKRSLKYLWPYRKRLALALVCVVVVASLWGGGLGLIGPGASVIMDEQGMHGWVYRKLAYANFSARLAVTKLPNDAWIEPGRKLAFVITVNGVKKGDEAPPKGLQANHQILGFADQGREKELIRGDELLRSLAVAGEGSTLSLRVKDLNTGRIRAVSVKVAPPGWAKKMLGSIVELVPRPTTAKDQFHVLVGLMLTILVITYVRGLFRFIQEYLVETAVYRGIIDIRGDTYDAALRLPVTFYSHKGTTDTMSRFIRDTHGLARAQVTLFSKTMAEPAKAVAALVAAFFFSWQLTLLAMVAGPPAAILIRKFGKRMRRASKKALQGWAGLLGVVEETLSGIRVVKAYTMEGTERQRFFRANRRLFQQQKRIAWIDAATGPAVEALGITAAAGAGALGGYWIFSGQMDPEDFVGVMACMVAIFDPVRKLAKVVNRFQRADAAAGRIFELQDQPKERSLPGAPMLGRHGRDIEVRNVSFRYPAVADNALTDVNLKVTAGQTIAIVGPNGCGKTTLVSLIPRLLDPAEGQVLIDGNDVSQFSIRSLRRQISLVTQETVIFHASIRDNIAYGLRRPSQEDVIAAAKKAYVDEFVEDMPERYETVVGEHGATLSGGQRQRISIARAMLRDPAILIFDEATSQIDADSEQRIHQALESFTAGRTTLMIAHRFATVLQADSIVVMDEGRIVDMGSHEQLLERCGLYKHLYQTQLGAATK